ncbi:hypothetical protein Droror1_Dr00010148 [Drosera rotundifolia]
MMTTLDLGFDLTDKSRSDERQWWWSRRERRRGEQLRETKASMREEEEGEDDVIVVVEMKDERVRERMEGEELEMGERVRERKEMGGGGEREKEVVGEDGGRRGGAEHFMSRWDATADGTTNSNSSSSNCSYRDSEFQTQQRSDPI